MEKPLADHDLNRLAERNIPSHLPSHPIDPQHDSCTRSVLLRVPAILGKQDFWRRTKGWGETRLTTRELGIIIIIIIVVLQTFFWFPFSALQMEEELWLSALKLLPGTLTAALALTPLGSRAGKRGISSCEQHSPAAS